MAAAKNVDFPIQSELSSSSLSSESEGEFEYINKLAVEKYECIICHHIIKDFIELPCGHIGCNRCIKKWGETTYK